MLGEILAVLATFLFEDSDGIYTYRAYRYYTYYYNYNYYSYRYYYYYSGSTGYIGSIVGGVFGVLIFIGILITLICCCAKSKGRTGRVIVPANSGTVSYISGQPTVSYQTTTSTMGPMAPPPYTYSNPAYPPGAVPQPYPAYPNQGGYSQQNPKQPTQPGYPNQPPQQGYPNQPPQQGNPNQPPQQGYPNHPPPQYQPPADSKSTNPPMPQPEGQGPQQGYPNHPPPQYQPPADSKSTNPPMPQPEGQGPSAPTSSTSTSPFSRNK